MLEKISKFVYDIKEKQIVTFIQYYKCTPDNMYIQQISYLFIFVFKLSNNFDLI